MLIMITHFVFPLSIHGFPHSVDVGHISYPESGEDSSFLFEELVLRNRYNDSRAGRDRV